jgi:hypothetical protein
MVWLKHFSIAGLTTLGLGLMLHLELPLVFDVCQFWIFQAQGISP